ncbi:MAG: hypothetical protein WC675_03240 [Patescibacteria group bacterium]
MPIKSTNPMRPQTSIPSSVGGGDKKRNSDGGSWVKGLVTLIVILVIIGGGLYLIAGYAGVVSLDFLPLPGEAISTEGWQAVFLTNGQVYFGKIAEQNKDYLVLKEIYYLQVVTSSNTIAQPSDVQTQPEQRLTLIKLGSEIHGPKDSMMINREHVVIIEGLKDDSRVVQAINDYLTNKTPDAADTNTNTNIDTTQ